ncbi:MAG: hypothetical protein ACJ8FT_10910 [Sphingomonas sp.]
MNRYLVCAGATLFAFATVTSASLAASTDGIHFALDQRGGSDRIQAHFRDDAHGKHDDNWSAGLMPSDLIGLEVSSFRGSGTRPIRFAIVRDAGRLDCAGSGGKQHATGNCRFSDNPAFTQLLVSRGIGRPTEGQSFGLMAVNARRDLIEAVAAARYPAPTIDDLMALSALGVDGAYISQMASIGYRPRSIETLIQFKALGITPQWLAGFVRVGYANVPGDGLMQIRALGITPEFIAGYQRIGYRNLPVHTLVQLKALNITPEFVRSTVGPRAPLPPVDELVQIKLFGKRR